MVLPSIVQHIPAMKYVSRWSINLLLQEVRNASFNAQLDEG
jgi:hypothetical protein